MKNLFKKFTNKTNRGLDDNDHLHQHQTPPPQPPPQQPSFSPSASAQHSPAYSTTEPPLAYPYPNHQPLQQGGVMNSGGYTNGSGAQKQKDGKEYNEKKKSGGVVIGKIGGNHDNTNGTNVTGHITLGNIG
ncbi:unnamed protein product [Amaranthus hypochondriacus]